MSNEPPSDSPETWVLLDFPLWLFQQDEDDK